MWDRGWAVHAIDWSYELVSGCRLASGTAALGFLNSWSRVGRRAPGGRLTVMASGHHLQMGVSSSLLNASCTDPRVPDLLSLSIHHL